MKLSIGGERGSRIRYPMLKACKRSSGEHELKIVFDVLIRSHPEAASLSRNSVLMVGAWLNTTRATTTSCSALSYTPKAHGLLSRTSPACNEGFEFSTWLDFLGRFRSGFL